MAVFAGRPKAPRLCLAGKCRCEKLALAFLTHCRRARPRRHLSLPRRGDVRPRALLDAHKFDALLMRQWPIVIRYELEPSDSSVSGYEKFRKCPRLHCVWALRDLGIERKRIVRDAVGSSLETELLPHCNLLGIGGHTANFGSVYFGPHNAEVTPSEYELIPPTAVRDVLSCRVTSLHGSPHANEVGRQRRCLSAEIICDSR
jgi:hypothetical protein